MSQWHIENKEKLKEWREKNKEKLNAKSREWQKNNRERAYENSRRWREKNREKLAKRAKKYREENREIYLQNKRTWTENRKKTDPLFKFSENVRALVNLSFKKSKSLDRKNKKTEEILGCSMEEFIEYILSLCPKNVKIEDFGQFGYHLDHKIPISLAKSREDVIKLNHYTNFQPLWWRDNIIKSNKIN